MENKKSWFTPFGIMVTAYFLAWGFSAMDRLLIAMMFPIILPYFHLGYAQGGLIMTCMSVGSEALGLVGGVASDKYGRRKVAIPSVWLFTLGSAFTGIATNFVSLIGIRSTVGGGEGAFNIAATAQIAEESRPEKRGFYIGLYTSAFALFGSFVAPLYAALVAPRLGWRWTFYLTIIPGIIIILIIQKLVKESKRFTTSVTTKHKVSWLTVIKEKNILVGVLLATFWYAWLWSWLGFGTSFFVHVKHLSFGHASVLQSALGAGGFLGMIVVSGFSDRWGRKPTINLGAIIGILGTIGIVFIPAGSYATLFATYFIMAFMTWGIAPTIISTIPSESVPADWIGTGIAVVTAFGQVIGIAIGQPVVGMIGDKYGLTRAMLSGTVTLLIVLLLSIFVLRETAPRFAKPKAPPLAAAAN